MKVGNGSGFWGDDQDKAVELLAQVPDLDYLTFDYLAELSMSILVSQQEKDPTKGYAEDFVHMVKKLEKLKSPCKLISNAGGLNPKGLKEALSKITSKKITAISGDDVRAVLLKDPENPLYRNMETNEPFTTISGSLKTANAYIGADLITDALNEGAEIVVTGRVADPSLTVAACRHYYKWKDWDLIAQATVAGHLIECGAQATGGLWTRWDTIENPEKIPFPYVEFADNGSFLLSKPPGGIINRETTLEQLLYEMGDPSHYLSPDVTLTIQGLKIVEEPRGVSVRGAKGSPYPATYKVSATYFAGYRAEGSLLFIGENSRKRAEKCASIIIEKIHPDKHHIDTLTENNRTYLRVAVQDQDEKKLKQFTKAFAPFVTAGPPGTTGYTGGRAKVRPVFGYWPCLIEREKVCALKN